MPTFDETTSLLRDVCEHLNYEPGTTIIYNTTKQKDDGRRMTFIRCSFHPLHPLHPPPAVDTTFHQHTLSFLPFFSLSQQTPQQAISTLPTTVNLSKKRCVHLVSHLKCKSSKNSSLSSMLTTATPWSGMKSCMLSWPIGKSLACSPTAKHWNPWTMWLNGVVPSMHFNNQVRIINCIEKYMSDYTCTHNVSLLFLSFLYVSVCKNYPI